MLYAINGGVDEKLKMQVGPKEAPMMDEVLDYDKVMARMDHFMDWLAKQYVTALNIIHYMHDKYSYEAALMALHDRDVYRTMACGIAGLSVAADSLSAIKYAKVTTIRDEDGPPSTSKWKASIRSSVTTTPASMTSLATGGTFHEENSETAHLPQCGTDSVRTDHHLQRGVR